jgi:general secretion pathway protein G
MRDTLKRLNEKRQQDDGFTLIELLVVIVIIGILAGVVVFAVGGITDKGETNAAKADKRTMETAEEAYYADQPSSLLSVYASESDLVTGGFLEQVSTTHKVCLADGTHPAGAAKAYSIVPNATACPGNMPEAP